MQKIKNSSMTLIKRECLVKSSVEYDGNINEAKTEERCCKRLIISLTLKAFLEEVVKGKELCQFKNCIPQFDCNRPFSAVYRMSN
jgi:hypothetical protein